MENEPRILINMKIVSCNVNGLRAAYRKSMVGDLLESGADIICLQETKMRLQDAEDGQFDFGDYRAYWASAKRKGYSGVLLLTKEEPVSVDIPDSGIFGEEGRLIRAEYPNFTLLTSYFPNGGTRADGTEMLGYKLDFFDAFLDRINTIRDSGRELILCGDFNVAHTEQDIARPRENANSIGFLPQERQKISGLVSAGYIDVFRKLNPEKVEYSWWSMRTNARARNVGWRIDYFFATRGILSKISHFAHRKDIMGSDHCPLEIVIK